MDSLHWESLTSEVWPYEQDKPDNFHVFSYRDVAYLLIFIKRTEPVPNGSFRVVWLHLKQYAAKLYVASAGSERQLSNRVVHCEHRGWYQSVFEFIHGLKFFADKQGECLGLSYLYSLVKRRYESRKVGCESCKDFTKVYKWLQFCVNTEGLSSLIASVVCDATC